MPDARAADALTLDLDALAYDASGLVACVCQDDETGDVLMLAWANRAALERTLETRRATFWSRSRGELWEKGATSGNALDVLGIRPDCDGDALLLRVRPRGPACHTGAETCFGARAIWPGRLRDVIGERRGADPTRSYVASLLAAEREASARKVGEEAVEVLLAEPGSDALVEEAADLLFHLMVLLERDGRDPLEPLAVLRRRHAERAG